MAKAKLFTLQANVIICHFRCSFFFFCSRDFMQFPIFRTFDKSVYGAANNSKFLALTCHRIETFRHQCWHGCSSFTAHDKSKSKTLGHIRLYLGQGKLIKNPFFIHYESSRISRWNNLIFFIILLGTFCWSFTNFSYLFTISAFPVMKNSSFCKCFVFCFCFCYFNISLYFIFKKIYVKTTLPCSVSCEIKRIK